MFGFITRQAVSVGAQPRRRVAVETRRNARVSNGGARQVLGMALVTIGQRVAGEMPAGPAAQANGDCT
ncbi:MAG: hypothetical protein M3P32_08205 [Chloroflexota bacterium]|nr:hypothetical protein [Chloroflexota bacterium]